MGDAEMPAVVEEPREPAAPSKKAKPKTDGGSTVSAAPTDSAAVERYVLVVFQDLHFEPRHLSAIDGGLVMELRRRFEDTIDAPRDDVEIDLWLESPGGDAHAAYKVALLLRAYASKIRVIVPDFAKSAATLLALVADEIYMGSAAELGPLDAQIPNEGGMVGQISALDVARSVDDLTTAAMEQAFRGGAEVLQITGLSRAESLSTMLDFAAKFMEPIIRQVDPRMIHWASTLLDVSVAYGTRLLTMRDGAGPHPEAMRIPRLLVEEYPTHGFVISAEEASERLGLPVQSIVKYDLRKEAIALHRRYEDGRANLIELLRADEVTMDANGGDADGRSTEDN